MSWSSSLQTSSKPLPLAILLLCHSDAASAIYEMFLIISIRWLPKVSRASIGCGLYNSGFVVAGELAGIPWYSRSYFSNIAVTHDILALSIFQVALRWANWGATASICLKWSWGSMMNTDSHPANALKERRNLCSLSTADQISSTKWLDKQNQGWTAPVCTPRSSTSGGSGSSFCL